MRSATAAEAVSYVHDGDTIVIGGSGGHAVPESLIVALEQRFLQEGRPRSLTSLHPVGIGDGDRQGLNRLAHKGLLRRVISGTFVDSPAISGLANEDAIEAYTMPQGALSQLMREMAAGRPGLISRIGLGTFVDPRLEGGRQSRSAVDDLVEVLEIDGREWLRYRPLPVDVAFLRGTTADEDGNVTMEEEAIFGEMLSMAQATRRCGGLVIVQVRRIAKRQTLPPKDVKIPGILVDLVVVEPDPWQTFATRYSPAFAGQLRVPEGLLDRLPLDGRKVVARRAAMELVPGAVCNLGVGISTGIASVAAEEGVLDAITLTNEQGLIGGAPASGVDAGAATNFDAMIDQPYQFDFYDGGGLDLAFLSFAEADARGDVNVSRFAGRIIGPGGFINISQSARKVIFSASFTSGGLELEIGDGHLRVISEGRHRKFVETVEQVTYNGDLGASERQEVLFITERAVFRRAHDGLELIEVAPGIDVQRDILDQMGFRPRIASRVSEMDARIFRPAQMGLRADLERGAAPVRAARLAPPTAPANGGS